MKTISPTQRTLARLRDMSYMAEVVERWNAHARCTQDLFNCVDIVACGRERVFFVQTTSDSNHAARERKSEIQAAVPRLVDGGCEFEVWSWGKKGGRGKVKSWTLRATRIEYGAGGLPTWVDVSHQYGEAL